jgi:hypothetical protein
MLLHRLCAKRRSGGAEFAEEIALDRLFEITPTPMLALLASTLPARGREKKVPAAAICEGPNAGKTS